jgi:hypothetical protein
MTCKQFDNSDHGLMRQMPCRAVLLGHECDLYSLNQMA